MKYPKVSKEIRQYFPTEQLKPYVKYFVVSEKEQAGEYKVLPWCGLVIGLQFRGQLSVFKDDVAVDLKSSEITGVSDGFKIFRSSSDIGTILIYLSETGFAHLAPQPANELVNLSTSLEDIFSRRSIEQVGEKLHFATTDEQKIKAVEQFLLNCLNDKPSDKLIGEAIKLIRMSNGTIRMKTLSEKLFISQSPLEKRFRAIVGTSPKKFASIIRFSSIISQLKNKKSLGDITYDNGFYDPAHFSKEFKQYTGETPEVFKALLSRKRFFTATENSDSAPSPSDFQVKAFGV